MRILLIKDSNSGRHRALQALVQSSKTKYDVRTASTYYGSLELITRDIHDLYLVDSHIGMPERNGIKLIREARKAGCTAPMILLARSETEQTIREVLEVGAILWSNTKMFTARDLENVLLSCHYASLEKINQEKTEQLEQLRIQIKELSEREKELKGLKARLLTMALHEFRSPLTTIYSSAELILRYSRTTDQDSRARHVARIKSCVDKFLLTLDDFKMLDECTTDKIVVHQEPLNIFSLCKQVIREVEESYDTRLIHYSHLSPKTIALMDSRLLAFIVRQLLLNAVKFSHDSQPVTCTTSIYNSSLYISVSDRGIGIPKEEQQYLFAPFFRASNALNFPGTGLGLSLAAAYTKKMNGNIVIESEKDIGSVLELSFIGAGLD